MKAIDVHGHFGTYRDGDGALKENLMSGSIETIRQRAKDCDILLTVVSALRGLMNHGRDVLKGNDEALEVSEKYSEIRFWAILNPRIEESYSQVESLLKHPRCKGIKIHPTEHSYHIRDQGDEIFSFADSNKAILISHSGCRRSLPDDFIHFAGRYPGVSLILAHLGNSYDGDLSRQVNALKKAESKNVYIDTSSCKSIISGLIEWAVSEIGAQRIVFGTDTPLYVPACQKARIEHAEIEKGARRAILFENAKRLLKESM